jgi:hypothetical protein
MNQIESNQIKSNQINQFLCVKRLTDSSTEPSKQQRDMILEQSPFGLERPDFTKSTQIRIINYSSMVIFSQFCSRDQKNETSP